MKVQRLIEILSQVDPNREVILSRDAEGNRYSPLASFDLSMYSEGEVGLETLTEEDRQMGYSEEDVMSEGKAAIVLYPA